MVDKDLNALPPGSDATILRPRPGGGKRASAAGGWGAPGSGTPDIAAAGTSGAASSVVKGTVAAGASSTAAASPTHSTADVHSLNDFLHFGRNPILQAAAPLLTLAVRLQTSAREADITALRREATREMQAFRDRLGAAGVSQDDANVASYIVCTFVDAAVLNTPWGAQSTWSSQSLLATFHHETVGGVKFFQILNHVRTKPARYIGLIELLTICLAFGFEGQHRLDERGPAKLAELQRDAFNLVRAHRPRAHDELSPRWRGARLTRNPILRFVPWWMVVAAGVLILVGGFVWFHTQLASRATLVKTAFALPAAKLEYVAAVPSHSDRLHELLAAQELAGLLRIEELGDKTVVTLTAADLFRSGSARVNPKHYATLRDVAVVLNAVPGRVLIVGHTDDQPVRSLQFADNFELSRERALAVAEVLKPAIADFGRIQWGGLGASEPRYRPVSTLENRARNRRVEVILLQAGRTS